MRRWLTNDHDYKVYVTRINDKSVVVPYSEERIKWLKDRDIIHSFIEPFFSVEKRLKVTYEIMKLLHIEFPKRLYGKATRWRPIDDDWFEERNGEQDDR